MKEREVTDGVRSQRNQEWGENRITERDGGGRTRERFCPAFVTWN